MNFRDIEIENASRTVQEELAKQVAEINLLRQHNENLRETLAIAIGVASELHSLIHEKARDSIYGRQADFAHRRLEIAYKRLENGDPINSGGR